MAKILVVDDEELIRNLLENFLTRKGYVVLTAASGKEALEKIKEGPAIVVLDIMMPDMDGLAVLDKIKQTAPDMEIIIITGLNDHAVGVESMRRGAFEFVTKPLDLEHLHFLLDFKLSQMELG